MAKRMTGLISGAVVIGFSASIASLGVGLAPVAAASTQSVNRMAVQAEPVRKTHTVQPGETLSGIAGKFGVEVGELMAYNGYEDPTKLLAGTTIEIPAKAGKPKPKPKPKPQPGTGETVYTTVAGDTYASVAKKFRITEEELRIYNGSRAPDKLPPGYKLYIPSN